MFVTLKIEGKEVRIKKSDIFRYEPYGTKHNRSLVYTYRDSFPIEVDMSIEELDKQIGNLELGE